MAQIAATNEYIEDTNLSFLIYSCVFLAKNVYSTFDDFFEVIIVEWREQEGTWSLEEQAAFREAQKERAKSGGGDYHAITYVLFERLTFTVFPRIVAHISLNENPQDKVLCPISSVGDFMISNRVTYVDATRGNTVFFIRDLMSILLQELSYMYR